MTVVIFMLYGSFSLFWGIGARKIDVRTWMYFQGCAALSGGCCLVQHNAWYMFGTFGALLFVLADYANRQLKRHHPDHGR